MTCAGTLRDGSACKTNAPPGQKRCEYHQAVDERGEVYRQAWGMGLLHIHVPEGAEIITILMPAKKLALFWRYLQDAGMQADAEIQA